MFGSNDDDSIREDSGESAPRFPRCFFYFGQCGKKTTNSLVVPFQVLELQWMILMIPEAAVGFG